MGLIHQFLLKNIDHVFFNSTYTQKIALDITPITSSSVMHPTVNCEKFKPIDPSQKENALKEFNLPADKKIILAMGLLVEKKGFEYLIDAFAYLLQHIKVSTKYFLVIAGDGARKKELIQQVEKHNIKEYVMFVGQVPSNNTPLLFNCADVLVLPSIIDSKGETETFGVVLVEAMACEVPVIASHIGGIPDVVTKEVGFLVPQKDSDALAKKIDLLLTDDNLREQMGKNARKRVLTHFTWKKDNNPLMQFLH